MDGNNDSDSGCQVYLKYYHSGEQLIELTGRWRISDNDGSKSLLLEFHSTKDKYTEKMVLRKGLFGMFGMKKKIVDWEEVPITKWCHENYIVISQLYETMECGVTS